MRLDAGCQIFFEATTPTPIIFMLRPRSGFGQWVVREEYLLQPNLPVTEYTDGYGTLPTIGCATRLISGSHYGNGKNRRCDRCRFFCPLYPN